MYSSKAGWSYAPPAVLLAVLFSSCSRQPAAEPPPERIAILRLENLSGDPSLGWVGPCFVGSHLAASFRAPANRE